MNALIRRRQMDFSGNHRQAGRSRRRGSLGVVGKEMTWIRGTMRPVSAEGLACSRSTPLTCSGQLMGDATSAGTRPTVIVAAGVSAFAPSGSPHLGGSRRKNGKARVIRRRAGQSASASIARTRSTSILTTVEACATNVMRRRRRALMCVTIACAGATALRDLCRCQRRSVNAEARIQSGSAHNASARSPRASACQESNLEARRLHRLRCRSRLQFAVARRDARAPAPVRAMLSRSACLATRSSRRGASTDASFLRMKTAMGRKDGAVWCKSSPSRIAAPPSTRACHRRVRQRLMSCWTTGCQLRRCVRSALPCTTGMLHVRHMAGLVSLQAMTPNVGVSSQSTSAAWCGIRRWLQARFRITYGRCARGANCSGSLIPSLAS